MFAVYLPSRGYWCGNMDNLTEYSNCVDDAFIAKSYTGIWKYCTGLDVHPEGNVVELCQTAIGIIRLN